MTTDKDVHAVNTPEPETREKYLRERGIAMTWEYLEGDPGKGEQVKFRFVMKRRGKEGEGLLVWEEFPYSCGCGHYTEHTYGKKPPFTVTKPLVPEVESFLECIRMDCSYVRCGESFDDFIDNMGLNDNAKEANRVWEAIQKEWAALQRILGEDDARAFVDLDIEDQWR